MRRDGCSFRPGAADQSAGGDGVTHNDDEIPPHMLAEDEYSTDPPFRDYWEAVYEYMYEQRKRAWKLREWAKKQMEWRA